MHTPDHPDGSPWPVDLCAAEDLTEPGPAYTFEVLWRGQCVSAFALRFEGRVVAYLNRCAHQPAEMDWNPGEFLDADRAFILCSIHGASYDPRNGRCAGGPCGRGQLVALTVKEQAGRVAWYPSAGFEPVSFT
ncbi:MAG: Rieske (2Fe-2S) protein [Betaproteobacteria bacterium]|nr:Rieske (2Fe-2S) protein [Betaproteobacteria bacterium]NBT10722.1 Rieske (2Fe-2S) protein [Betaproteobacteria bacterium]NBU49935.1 Rieske (2Fe-2S) protein [Betaproteobacteria bacterium]NBX96179.1 Rieske (2Fe-2S) protein [Betaproteobacteria bacterium]